jgi:hypothetical protein
MLEPGGTVPPDDTIGASVSDVGSDGPGRISGQEAAQRAAVTVIILVSGSSVPVTTTLCAANCFGVCWSLSS